MHNAYGSSNDLNGSSYIESIQAQPAALSRQCMLSPSKNVNSKGLTFANQNKLPRLPIPSLEDTIAKVPSRLAALLDETEMEEARKALKDFSENEGKELQQRLIEYEKEGFENEKIGSYIEEFWNESYLSPDISTVLNLNPFFILEDGPDPKIAKDQLRRAASLCFASVKFASALRSETLAPDSFRNQPLCMDQFKVLFGSSRQPVSRLDTNQDDVYLYSDSSHVVVLHKNQFYYFPALWPDNGNVAVDEADIFDILKAIVKHADTNLTQAQASASALGVLTSLQRSEWAVARREMCLNEANQLALKVIDSALFVLVLDDYVPLDIHSAAANALHGTNQLIESDNSTIQVGSCLNRWYDKLQIIICKDGTSQVNFEHATIDGHTALRLVSDVFAETVISFAESIVKLIHGQGHVAHVIEAVIDRAATNRRKTLDVLPKKLVFELPESTMKRIYFAESALCDSVVASDTYVLEFTDYGKNLIVANKMSPDAYVQMSILLAYYTLYGRVVCMYEPAMTKAFYHGRTEAIRGATLQAKELCQLFCDKNATNEDKLEALHKATAEHSRLTKESASGKGIDRHLYALMCLSTRLGMPTPKFFKSIAWKTLSHTIISTSNCGNPSLRLFGFGPVVPDGFGVGYIIKDQGISYSVSSKHRQTKRFVGTLRNSLKAMEELLVKHSTLTIQQRTPLVTKETNRLGSYGDLWGEHTATIPSTIATNSSIMHEFEHEASHLHQRKSGSSIFAKVHERDEKSVDLLGLEKIKIDVNLEEANQ